MARSLLYYNQKEGKPKQEREDKEMTVKELMEMLKALNPETEVHCFDSELGWSELEVTVNEAEGVVFAGK